MQLFVIRHAIAEDRRPDLDDADRSLTDEGARKMKQIARGLRALELSFERVLTSPWARARQTAELLAPVSDAPPIATDLLCQSPRAELLSLIAEGPGPTAVVGHQPWLGELVAWLAFGDAHRGESIDLKKGSVTELSGSTLPGEMTLHAILQPRALRGLGKRR